MNRKPSISILLVLSILCLVIIISMTKNGNRESVELERLNAKISKMESENASPKQKLVRSEVPKKLIKLSLKSSRNEDT